MAKSFYPNLLSIVRVDQFPEQLQFIQSGLENLLERVHYKELQFIKSDNGSSGYYKITLVTNEAISINLSESGFSLIANPGSTGETLIPLTVDYNWEILALINSFNLEEFSYMPEQLQEVLGKSISLSDTDLILTSVQTFEGGDNIDAFQSFVTKINNEYLLSGTSEIPSPADGDPFDLTEDIREAIEGNTSIPDEIQVLINKIYISGINSGSFSENIDRLSQSITGEPILDYIKRIIIPKIDASLELSVGLSFPRNMLVPLTGVGGDPLPDEEQSILIFTPGTLLFSTQGGIGFEEEMSASLNHPSQIGNTGLGINFTGVKLDLSKTKNIPEATADGRPLDFQGVYLKTAGITLPAKWFNDVDGTTLEIGGRNLLIGTGGISGTIALQAVGGGAPGENDYLDFKIGNWELGFKNFDIEFSQNSIVQSNLTGYLKIPKLEDSNGDPAQVDFKAHLYEDGDFSLTASEEDGIPLTLGEFVEINFKTLELGKDDDKFYIGTSCEVKFQNEIMANIFGNQKIVLPKLRVYDDGSMEIVGGNAFIPTNLNLNLGPVEVAVTGIHFGSHQQEHQGVLRTYNYWGFDGAISIDPLGIDARGEGLKYYYTTDDLGDAHSFIRIQSIEVDLVIPGTASPSTAAAIINGMVSIPEPGESREYVGEIGLKLPKAKISGGAAMKLQPKHPAFIVDAFIDLPSPIPLGPLGIYGFRGLFGYRYVAEKEAVGLVSGEDSWYDYYTADPKGIHVTKFSGPERSSEYSFPFSIGAGAVLGTGFDDGTVLSIRAMLLLSIPTLFMIEGRASVLSKRLDLDSNSEPPFFAFIAWGDGSIELGLGLDYQLPEDNGWILDLYAEVQAGFFFYNSSMWYVNFGTKEVPISAELLSIFTAQSYLMISAQGIEAGSRVSYEFKKKYGPVSVHLSAYLELGGRISFQNKQAGGYLALGGTIAARFMFIGLSISIDAILSVESAKPFLIYAELNVEVCVRIIKKFCHSFTVKLRWEKNDQVDTTPISPLPSTADADGNMKNVDLVKGVHMLTNETFEIDFLGQNLGSDPSPTSISSIIPLDTFIDIKSVKALNPGPVATIIDGVLNPNQHIGGYYAPPENHLDLIPPQQTVKGGHTLRQVKHEYTVEEIEIKASSNNGPWVPYHPFEAVVKADTPLELQARRDQVKNLPIGFWQKSGVEYNTIRLLSNSPFSFTVPGEPGWFIPEQYGITPSMLFCTTIPKDPDCSNVLDKELGKVYNPLTQYIGHEIDGAYYHLEGEGWTLSSINPDGTMNVVGNSLQMIVSNATNPHGFAQSLSFDTGNTMVIVLPEQAVNTELRLTTDSVGVTIRYYKLDPNQPTPYNPTQPSYVMIQEVYKTSSQLNFPVSYTNELERVSKIEIEPTPPDVETLTQLYQQLALLESEQYSGLTGFVDTSKLDSRFKIEFLKQEILTIESRFCGRKSDSESRKIVEMKASVDPESPDVPIVIKSKGSDEAKSSTETLPELSATESEKICQLKSRLLELFDTCFPEDLSKISQLSELLDCFITFQQEIFQADRDCPNIGLIQFLGSNYEKYLDYLEAIENYVNSGLKFTIKEYYSFRAEAQIIIEKIGRLTDCDQKPPEDEICQTSLQQICWLSQEDYDYNQQIPGMDAIAQEQMDLQEAIEEVVQPVWRPNTKFLVRFKLKDTVDNGANHLNAEYYYGFQTAGPVGHYHNEAGVRYGNEYTNDSPPSNSNIANRVDMNNNPSLNGKLTNPEKYPLTSLRKYINYDRSYPNANGNLLKAKPLFYGHNQCKISMFFNKPLAYHMFNLWHDYNGLPELFGQLDIAIKDPVSGVIIPYPLPVDFDEDTVPIPVPGSLQWESDTDPMIPLDLQAINGMIDSDQVECSLVLGDPILPNSPFFNVTLTNLKPSKLYTALIYNVFDKDEDGTTEFDPDERTQVHDFVFQTSRYANFREQVESYVLKELDDEGLIVDQRQAIFKLDHRVDADQVQLSYNIVANGYDTSVSIPESDDLQVKYYHLFDRVLEGVMGISPLDPPISTEFNLILKTKANPDDPDEVAAILIRNPEPFNNPKIPIAEILDTIQVMVSLSTEDLAYKILFSNDYSQALIMHDSLQISDLSLKLKFEYKIWTGSDFIVDPDPDGTVLIEDLLLEI